LAGKLGAPRENERILKDDYGKSLSEIERDWLTMIAH
jgi:hypothetical protein